MIGEQSVIGRDRELADLARAIRHHDVRWVTGPAGIGKSALARRALRGAAATEWIGAWMETRGDAVAYLSEVLGCSPRNQGTAALGHWLCTAVPTLPGTAVLLWDDFHRVDRAFANLFLQLLRNLRLPYAVILLSREYWSVPGLWSNRIRHRPLGELAPAAVERLCRLHGRSATELPPAIGGHPYLVRLFLEEGATSVEAWAERLARELDPEAARLLERLCLTQTPLQERWAFAGSKQESGDTLRQQGLWRGDGHGLQPVLEAIRSRMEQEGRRAELERELLDYLAGRPSLPERDLNMAAALCRRVRDEVSLVKLIERYAEKGLTDSHLAVLQPEIDRLLAGRRLPPKLKILSFRTLTHSYEVAHFLRLHDLLIRSPEPDEALLAKLCFLKAAAESCLRDLPREFDRYWEEVMACPLTPEALRSNLVQLKVRIACNNARPGNESVRGLLRRLGRTGAESRVVEGYRRLFRASEHFWSLDLGAAVRELEHSDLLFREAGQETAVEQNGRFLLILYYLTNRDEDLRRTLRYLESCSLNHDEPREFCTILRNLFEAKLRWQMGDFSSLEQQTLGLPDYPCYLDHPLLPGPHFLDYLPFLYAVCRDRTLDRPPNAEHLRIFTRAMTRLRFLTTLSLGAVVAAQHLLLRSPPGEASAATADAAELEPLLQALETSHPYAEAHARRLRVYQRLLREEKGQLLVRKLTDWLEEAILQPERLTAPYYVLLAARQSLAGGLDPRPLHGFLANSPSLEQLAGYPRWITRICCERLARAARLRRKAGGDIPVSVRGVIEAQIWRGVRDPGGAGPGRFRQDPAVSALKDRLDKNWYQQLHLADAAAGFTLSPSALSRRFRMAFGVSPKQYQQRQRLEQARILMLTTDWDLTAIAYECGFFDSAQFSRMFRAAAGCSPSEFRKRHRGRN